MTSKQLIPPNHLLGLEFRGWKAQGHEEAAGGSLAVMDAAKEARDFSGMKVVADVVLSPAGINY